MSPRERKSSTEAAAVSEKGENKNPTAPELHCSTHPGRLLNCCRQLQEQVKEFTQINAQRMEGTDSPTSVQEQHTGFVFLFAATQVPAVKAI